MHTIRQNQQLENHPFNNFGRYIPDIKQTQLLTCLNSRTEYWNFLTNL